MLNSANLALKEFLDKKVKEYNKPSFIIPDPVSIPHKFKRKQDIEIAAFFAAVFAWGNRTTIINKSTELIKLMDDQPYDFCINHSVAELKNLTAFKHRTFNSTDLLYFISFFHRHYHEYDSLESAFFKKKDHSDINAVEKGLNHFYNYFFSLPDVPTRTVKHIASPNKKSSCKRLNMFLRWMVRKDQNGVDFGIWKRILPAQLICPVDVHVARVARHFKLLERRNTDWQAAIELTAKLAEFDRSDPVKYDFALFGIGIMEKF